jgi:type I restriction enzyme M protein
VSPAYASNAAAIATSLDTRLLYSSGIRKLRCLDHRRLSSHLLLALLNTPVVKRQIQAKRFTRDIIDMLGHRIFELVLPIPRSEERCHEIATAVRLAVEERAALRDEELRQALALEGAHLDEDEQELVRAEGM